MKRGTDRGMRRWRAATLLALGVVIGMVMVATPAGAHVGGTVNHLWGHLKPKTDARYLQNTIRVVESGGTVALGGFDAEIVNCPAGYQAIGGGVDINQVAGADIASSHPVRDGNRALTLAD